MSFSKLHIAEILIEGFIKTPISLQEQTLEGIAIKLCHNLNMKQCIFFPKLEIADSSSAEQIRKEWEKAIKKESTEICKTLLLPHTLQEILIGKIRSIALRLLMWSGEWKKVFDISCYLTAHFWMPTDWVEGRINERKVAERFMRDGRISIDQRYRLACVYCLEEFIFLLWDHIPLEQRDLYVLDDPHGLQKSLVVERWSEYMRDPESFECEDDFFWTISSHAMVEQQTTAVIFAWNKLSDGRKRCILKQFIDLIRQGKCLKRGDSQVLPFMNNFRIQLPTPPGQGYITCFLLSQIREQKIDAFEEEFKSCEYKVEYFLEAPH